MVLSSLDHGILNQIYRYAHYTWAHNSLARVQIGVIIGPPLKKLLCHICTNRIINVFVPSVVHSSHSQYQYAPKDMIDICSSFFLTRLWVGAFNRLAAAVSGHISSATAKTPNTLSHGTNWWTDAFLKEKYNLTQINFTDSCSWWSDGKWYRSVQIIASHGRVEKPLF